MPEIRLRQPGFTYSACGPLTKNNERIQKFKGTGDSRYKYQIELDKAYFQHDMAYEDFKYLPRIAALDKELLNKTFDITKNPKYDRYQQRLDSMVYKFFYKRTYKTNKETGTNSENKELAIGIHKPIRKLRKVHSSFIGIFGALI